MSTTQASSQVVRRAVLMRYRVMAYVTGVFLIVLIFVAVPIQVLGHDKTLEAIVGTAHGYLYMIYLITAFELTIRLRIPLVRLVLVALAGTIPFAGFVAERKMTKAWEANQRAAAEQVDAR